MKSESLKNDTAPLQRQISFLINKLMQHKPGSIFNAAAEILMGESVPPPRRISKEITYTTKLGNTRVTEVSPASEAEEKRTIIALGGKIVKVETITH